MQAFAIGSPSEAIRLMLDHTQTLATQRVPLADAPGYVLAQTVRADRPSPACDVSAMDGYALRASDLQSAASLHLKVVAEALPGIEPPPMLDEGTLRIMTGAPVPPGVDLVIKREDTTEEEDAIAIVPDVLAKLKVGDNIRREGENIAQDAVVAEPGVEITPTLAGMLSLFGVQLVEVCRTVRAAVITTGDEVLPADSAPKPWQLRDSNGPTLAALLKAKGWLTCSAQTHADDQPGSIAREIETALDNSDMLFLTGGVSMGDRDYVPAVLRDLGAQILFHKLPQRPGKPALAAVMPGGQPVLALPGNPVAVAVTARRLGAPVLRRLAGLTAQEHPRLVTLDNPDGKSLKLWWHRLVRLTPEARAEIVPTMGSGDIVSAAQADGFIEVPPDDTSNGPFPFLPWTL